MDDEKHDGTDGRPHGDRIVSHGHDRRAAETGELPRGFDAAESGVADAVPSVPSDNTVSERAGDTADTGGEVARTASPDDGVPPVRL